MTSLTCRTTLRGFLIAGVVGALGRGLVLATSSVRGVDPEKLLS